MTYVLGDPIVSGSYTIAIVSRQVVAGRQRKARGVSGYCSKEPVYVVVRKGKGCAALDMTGAKVPLQDVQALCPAVTGVWPRSPQAPEPQ